VVAERDGVLDEALYAAEVDRRGEQAYRADRVRIAVTFYRLPIGIIDQEELVQLSHRGRSAEHAVNGGLIIAEKLHRHPGNVRELPRHPLPGDPVPLQLRPRIDVRS